MLSVGIVGATGYAGAELVRILSGHPDAEIAVLTSRQYEGQPFSEAFPSFRGIVDQICQAYNPETINEQAELVFLALPHQLPMNFVPELLGQGKSVIDLSADFRFRDAGLYESVYQAHTAPDLLLRTVYGLSEINHVRIHGADLVGNPGCYPTSVLLPLVPLLAEGLICADELIADSKSGVSGAGRSPAVGSLFSEVAESFKPYKVASHRHAPEMNMVLSEAAGQSVHITFVPHLVPMSRGMQTTIYAGMRGDATKEHVWECLRAFYDDKPFVRICPEGAVPDSQNVRGSNYCDIGVAYDAPAGRLILMSAIDNLVKGAAGQAVQNMNIMLGMDETTGLDGTPYPL